MYWFLTLSWNVPKSWKTVSTHTQYWQHCTIRVACHEGFVVWYKLLALCVQQLHHCHHRCRDCCNNGGGGGYCCDCDCSKYSPPPEPPSFVSDAESVRRWHNRHSTEFDFPSHLLFFLCEYEEMIHYFLSSLGRMALVALLFFFFFFRCCYW